MALISETMLTAADKPKFPGYHVYRQDEFGANRAYRGLMVLVRRSIVHQPLPTLSLASMQVLGVELFVAGAPLRVYAVYHPGTLRLDLAEVQLVLDSSTPVIVAGDWNCKHPAWNSAAITTDGRRLFNDSEARGYKVDGPHTPTHYPQCPTQLPDVIDLVVHRGLPRDPHQEVLLDHTGSDHQPVLVTMDDIPTRVAPSAPRPITDWNLFGERLVETTPTRPVDTANDVEQLASDLTNCIQDALKHASHVKPSQGALPPLPAHITKMLQEKRRLRKQWQRSRCPVQKTELNKLMEKIKSELADHRSESWERRIQDASDDMTSIHRLCRQLANKPAPVRPLIHADGSLRYRAEDRAEIFAESLERQFQPNPCGDAAHNAAVEQRLVEYFDTPIAHDEEPVIFTPGQVQRALRSTKPRKAPGADSISNTALRHLPYKTVAALTRLFNGISRTGHFPDQWKLGHVIMLPKPGKNILKPDSYRPITLLSCISKLFERLLLRHLVPHITPRREQFGFRREHSTTLQLARVLHQVAVAWNKREHTVAVFLDMEKAFDRVWHAGLIYKLAESPAPRRIVKVISSFLSGRRFKVMVEDAMSTEHPVAAGVPQGSCLSPICYSRYTDDIPVEGGAELALYADDAAYLTSSIRSKHAAVKMQRALDALPDWLSKWRLSVNVMKTQAIVITRQTNHPPQLRLQGVDIEWSPKVKYLGVTIDRRLTMGPHVSNVVTQTRIARNLLRPVLSSKLPLRVKVGVYKTYIRTRLTYAAPAWYQLVAETHRRKLRAQQALSLRAVADAPRYVRNSTIQRDLKIESLDDFISRLATTMFARADDSQLPHIQDLAPQHARPPDGKAYPRELITTNDTEPTHRT